MKKNMCIVYYIITIILYFEYRDLLKHKTINDIEMAIAILDKEFNEYPILKNEFMLIY